MVHVIPVGFVNLVDFATISNSVALPFPNNEVLESTAVCQ